MKLKEFIEKFCYKDTDVKIHGISTNSNSKGYMIFHGYEYDIASETLIFSIIEDLEVIGLRVDKDYLIIVINDKI